MLPVHRKICGDSMENQTLERKCNLPILHYAGNAETEQEVMSH